MSCGGGTLEEIDSVTATEQERAVLAMVRRHLLTARGTKMTGCLTFEINMQDGGITSKYAVPRIKEK